MELETYCITLPYRQNKLKRVQDVFSKQGIDVKEYSAVVGKDLYFERFNSDILTSRYKKHFMNTEKQRGHLGASFSHTGMWQLISDNNLGRTLILEDDVLIEDDFQEQLKERLESMNKIDPEWDILLLGFSCSYDSYKKCHMNDNIPLVGNIARVHKFMGLWCYVVNGKNAADNILNNCFSFSWHIDHWLTSLQEKGFIKIYGSIPSIGFHPGTFKISSWDYSVSKRANKYVSDTNL
jgi:GR25 family glycosyltransferase involved in LPS biosynthesis